MRPTFRTSMCVLTAAVTVIGTVLLGHAAGATIEAGATVSVLGQPDLNSISAATRCTGGAAQFRPTGVAIGPGGRLFVADFLGQRVLSWPNADALSTCQAADLVIGAGSLHTPGALTVGSDGTLYVSDANDQTVKIFTLSGGVYSSAPTVTLGTPSIAGAGMGQFSSPRGLALDAAGQLLVADVLNSRVQVFNAPFSSGETAVVSVTGFSGPRSVAAAGNQVFVGDYANGQVLRYSGPFSAAGSYSATATFGGTTAPSDLTVASNGTLLVTDDGFGTTTPQVEVYPNATTGGNQAVSADSYFFGGNITPGPDNTAGEALGVATDSSGRAFLADYGAYRLLISSPGNPSQLTISPSTLPDGAIHAVYPSTTLKATGGTGKVTWAVFTGALPAGMKLATTGVLSGTPTQTGQFTFKVGATDSGSPSKTGYATYSITISPMAISTSALPVAYVGRHYTTTLKSLGGSGGKVWSISAGALPTGMTFNRSGTLSGTAASPSTTTLTFRLVANSSPPQVATKTLTLTILPMSITTTSLPAGYVQKYYTTTLQAVGGRTTLHWTVAAGTLPAGMKLSTSGQLTGVVPIAGLTFVTLQVTDTTTPVHNIATHTYLIDIQPMTITTTALPNGRVGTSYSHTIVVQGGKATVTWSIVGGSLPPGIHMNTHGQLYGKPTVAGTYTFDPDVVDATKPSPNTAGTTLTITVTT